MKTTLRESIVGGDVRAIARILSRLEDGWDAEAIALLKELFSHTGKALVLGVTGSPGSGKSTLVAQLAGHYRRQGRRVGILAVDPTSPFSGGAILGDRIRMQSLATDPGVFIRSMATRGQLGGLAPAVHEALIVLDAAGYDTLIVETVGVGQDEIDIVKTAQVTLVVLVPGMGDDIQTIKAGLMEIADILVINKADRDNALRTEQELRAWLSISRRDDGWNPPIVQTVATRGQGIDQLVEAVGRYQQFLSAHTGGRSRLRLHRARLIEMLKQRLQQIILEKFTAEELDRYAEEMMRRESDPFSIVDRLLQEAGYEEESNP